MYKRGDVALGTLKNIGCPSDARASEGVIVDARKSLAYLPHSCDCWIIGGPEEIRIMIADLQAVLLQMKS